MRTNKPLRRHTMNRLTISVAALFFSFGTLLYAQQSSAASQPDWNGNNGSYGNHNGNSSNGSYGDHDRKYSKKHSSYNKFDRKENNFNHGRTDNIWRASYNKHDKKGNNNSSYGDHDRKYSKKHSSYNKFGRKENNFNRAST